MLCLLPAIKGCPRKSLSLILCGDWSIDRRHQNAFLAVCTLISPATRFLVSTLYNQAVKPSIAINRHQSALRHFYSTKSVRAPSITTMKAVISSVLLAATAVLVESQSVPCPSIPSSNIDNNQVTAAILQWNNSVNAVNYFVDNVYNLPAPLGLLEQAIAAYGNASNEPCQFSTLQLDLNNQSRMNNLTTCAIADIANNFQYVLGNLSAIIANPNDTKSAYVAAQAVINNRCCNILPDLNALWGDAVSFNGLSISSLAVYPDACTHITLPCEPLWACTNYASSTEQHQAFHIDL